MGSAQQKTTAVKKPDMIFIKGGTFQMGSLEQDYDQPVHTVTVSDFYLSRYETTVAQFNKFVTATGYVTEAEKNGDSSYVFTNQWIRSGAVNWRHDCEGKRYISFTQNNYPVVHISWNDAVAYCGWLSSTEHKAYRLPTAAEWEYAAGNGTEHTKYAWGNQAPSGLLENIRDEGSGWHEGFENYSDKYKFLAPVGTFSPNSLGLYDMNGNVSEWCNDWYALYTPEAQTNPQGAAAGETRSVRGANFASRPQYAGIADHNDSPPGLGRGSIGFRVAVVLQR